MGCYLDLQMPAAFATKLEEVLAAQAQQFRVSRPCLFWAGFLLMHTSSRFLLLPEACVWFASSLAPLLMRSKGRGCRQLQQLLHSCPSHACRATCGSSPLPSSMQHPSFQTSRKPAHVASHSLLSLLGTQPLLHLPETHCRIAVQEEDF
jgi:hypothetical protein